MILIPLQLYLFTVPVLKCLLIFLLSQKILFYLIVVIIWDFYLKTLSAQTYCEYAKDSREANMSEFHDIHEYSTIHIIRRGHYHHLISELMFSSCI